MAEPCGCGGKAVLHRLEGDHWAVSCQKCGIETDMYVGDGKAAIAAWNRAMGKDLRDAVDRVIADLGMLGLEEGCYMYEIGNALEAARKGAK